MFETFLLRALVFFQIYDSSFAIILLNLVSPLLLPCARYPVWATYLDRAWDPRSLRCMLNVASSLRLKTGLSLCYINNIVLKNNITGNKLIYTNLIKSCPFFILLHRYKNIDGLWLG